MRTVCLALGLVACSVVVVDAQGITAVTRRTAMAGAGFGGGFGAGQAAGGGNAAAGIEAVSISQWAASQVLLPEVGLPPGGAQPPGAGFGGIGGGLGGGGVNGASGIAGAPAGLRQMPVRRVPAPDPGMEARLVAFQQERAREGSPGAQLALGRRYRDGQGVEKSPALARVWLEAAARSGAAGAADELAALGPDTGPDTVAQGGRADGGASAGSPVGDRRSAATAGESRDSGEAGAGAVPLSRVNDR